MTYHQHGTERRLHYCESINDKISRTEIRNDLGIMQKIKLFASHRPQLR